MAGLAALLLLPLATACQGADQPGASEPSTSTSAVGCAGLAQPTDRGSVTDPGAGPAGGDAPALPALMLPCLADGKAVALASLRGPAVVNLWASWCAPCRRELPVLQEFADRNRGEVRVLGVVSRDSRSASAALTEDLKLSFPQLVDEQGRLIRAVGRAGLPVTLFVDAHGRIRFVYNADALDKDTLDRLASRHLAAVPA